MYSFHKQISFLDNEYWWGGAIDEGIYMPYINDYPKVDLNESNFGNQVTSFFISSKGRYFYSDEPIAFEIKNKTLYIDSLKEILLHDHNHNLKEAYYDCVKNYFKQDFKHPLKDMFTLPQYNTWIEMNWDINQQKVIDYAHQIIENGFKPGILMLDDGWQEDYGVWKFNVAKFPNPKEMIDELHRLGFKVILWLVPCVSPDSFTFREAQKDQIFYHKKNSQEIAIMEWWDGYSAVLDLTHPNAVKWLEKQCDYLQKTYHIDGFKFDGADDSFYPLEGEFYQNIPRIHQARLYSKFATKYPLNEMRTCFNMQGQGLAQRLTDKRHSWDDRGINMLIPNALAMSNLGYVFTCPDMIGGGLVGDFINNHYQGIDEQLFVRYAQIATFFPMMQFSLAPWKALSKPNLEIIKNCCSIHEQLNDYILKLVDEATKNVTPILRSMCFEYPDEGFETIQDQFMLGDLYLITPIVKKDCYQRDVILPKGKWKDDLNQIYEGGQTIHIDVPLNRIPYFIKINER